MVRGGAQCALTGGYFSMKKGSRGPKFLDFSEFMINFQKIKKFFFWFFTVFWGDLEGAGILCPPHSSYIQKPCTIRVKVKM